MKYFHAGHEFSLGKGCILLWIKQHIKAGSSGSKTLGISKSVQRQMLSE